MLYAVDIQDGSQCDSKSEETSLEQTVSGIEVVASVTNTGSILLMWYNE